jgi:chromosomal replication initiator protein
LQQMLDDLERENKKLRHRLGCFNSVVPTPTLAHAYVEAFCDGNLVCRKEMITSGRRRSVAYPRMALCWYLNKHTDMSLSSIGRMVGHKDHSTVIHAIRRVEADPQFNRYIELAEQWLAERALLPEDGQKIMVDAR